MKPRYRPGPVMLNSAEVAELFGVTPCCVSRWALCGRLASVRTPGGRVRLFPEADVLALVGFATDERKPDVPVS